MGKLPLQKSLIFGFQLLDHLIERIGDGGDVLAGPRQLLDAAEQTRCQQLLGHPLLATSRSPANQS